MVRVASEQELPVLLVLLEVLELQKVLLGEKSPVVHRQRGLFHRMRGHIRSHMRKFAARHTGAAR